MDKKLNRQILYDKKADKATPPQLPPKEKFKSILNTIAPITPDPNESGKIVAWINAHAYFKWSKMCLEIGFDKGNFQRLLKSKSPQIHIKYIEKITYILKQYGYE